MESLSIELMREKLAEAQRLLTEARENTRLAEGTEFYVLMQRHERLCLDYYAEVLHAFGALIDNKRGKFGNGNSKG